MSWLSVRLWWPHHRCSSGHTREMKSCRPGSKVLTIRAKSYEQHFIPTAAGELARFAYMGGMSGRLGSAVTVLFVAIFERPPIVSALLLLYSHDGASKFHVALRWGPDKVSALFRAPCEYGKP